MVALGDGGVVRLAVLGLVGVGLDDEEGVPVVVCYLRRLVCKEVRVDMTPPEGGQRIAQRQRYAAHAHAQQHHGQQGQGKEQVFPPGKSFPLHSSFVKKAL